MQNESEEAAHDALMGLPRVRILHRPGQAGGQLRYYSWDGRSAGHGERVLGRSPLVAMQKYREYEAGRVGGSGRMSRRVDHGEAFSTLPGWAKAMFHNARNRSKTVGRQFLLTADQFAELVRIAGGRCQLSDIELDTRPDAEHFAGPFAPSLDRIDSAKGYESGNCRIVCLIANMAMNTWGDAPLIALAQALLRKQHS